MLTCRLTHAINNSSIKTKQPKEDDDLDALLDQYKVRS